MNNFIVWNIKKNIMNTLCPPSIFRIKTLQIYKDSWSPFGCLPNSNWIPFSALFQRYLEFWWFLFLCISSYYSYLLTLVTKNESTSFYPYSSIPLPVMFITLICVQLSLHVRWCISPPKGLAATLLVELKWELVLLSKWQDIEKKQSGNVFK